MKILNPFIIQNPFIISAEVIHMNNINLSPFYIFYPSAPKNERHAFSFQDGKIQTAGKCSKTFLISSNMNYIIHDQIVETFFSLEELFGKVK